MFGLHRHHEPIAHTTYPSTRAPRNRAIEESEIDMHDVDRYNPVAHHATCGERHVDGACPAARQAI